MVKKIEVLYRGFLAHYDIQRNLLGSYTATLYNYAGKAAGVQPPSVVTLHQHGQSWLGHPGEQKLVDDIGYNILK